MLQSENGWLFNFRFAIKLIRAAIMSFSGLYPARAMARRGDDMIFDVFAHLTECSGNGKEYPLAFGKFRFATKERNKIAQ
jgi:hypothetical protein